jgi:hypothetical protein
MAVMMGGPHEFDAESRRFFFTHEATTLLGGAITTMCGMAECTTMAAT